MTSLTNQQGCQLEWNRNKKPFKVKNFRKVNHSFRVPIQTLYLPRPANGSNKDEKTKKHGVYPLHFERKLKKWLGTDKYLHAFAGWSTTGFRVDIRPEVNPDLIADIHDLPFPDNYFPGVVADPPYNNSFAKKLYGTPPLRQKEWVHELVRVCKPEGKIAIYHNYVFPRLPGCHYSMIIVTLLRIRCFPRVLTIFTKPPHNETNLESFSN